MFYIGQRFNSVEELETAEKVYEDTNYVELVKNDVRTLEAAKRERQRKLPALTQHCIIIH